MVALYHACHAASSCAVGNHVTVSVIRSQGMSVSLPPSCSVTSQSCENSVGSWGTPQSVTQNVFLRASCPDPRLCARIVLINCLSVSNRKAARCEASVMRFQQLGFPNSNLRALALHVKHAEKMPPTSWALVPQNDEKKEYGHSPSWHLEPPKLPGITVALQFPNDKCT